MEILQIQLIAASVRLPQVGRLFLVRHVLQTRTQTPARAHKLTYVLTNIFIIPPTAGARSGDGSPHAAVPYRKSTKFQKSTFSINTVS